MQTYGRAGKSWLAGVGGRTAAAESNGACGREGQRVGAAGMRASANACKRRWANKRADERKMDDEWAWRVGECDGEGWTRGGSYNVFKWSVAPHSAASVENDVSVAGRRRFLRRYFCLKPAVGIYPAGGWDRASWVALRHELA